MSGPEFRAIVERMSTPRIPTGHISEDEYRLQWADALALSHGHALLGCLMES